MKQFLFVIVLLTFSQGHARDYPDANPVDVGTIDGVITAYYESVSGHPGKRDVARLLGLYLPNGKININTSSGMPAHGTVEEVFASDDFQIISSDFFEREISRDEQRFGNLANIISTYGISDAMENKTYTARGITIFQMFHHKGRWWILSSVYQREASDLPLPAHLLD